MTAQVVAVIALGLLGFAGVAKVVDPDPTRGALEAARLPSSRALTRLLGVTEVTAAVAGLVLASTATLLSALLYLGFTLFTLAALGNTLPIQSCGCFGRDDTPPSWVHVVYNGVATLSLGVVAISGTALIPWSDPPSRVLLYLAFAAIGVYLSYLLLTRLPQTLSLIKDL